MANYMADTLKVKSVYVLDDTGAYGVGLADAFQAQAEKKGIKVLGRDRLDPKAADYASVLTKIKALNPQALYYGGVGQAGVKLAKQAYDIMPDVIKAGRRRDAERGPAEGRRVPGGGGLVCHRGVPARDGGPEDQGVQRPLLRPLQAAPGRLHGHLLHGGPGDHRGGEEGGGGEQAVTRDAVRDAIQEVKLPNSLLGPIEFDGNGDLKNKIISVFKITKDASKPLDEPDGAVQVRRACAPMG